MSTPFDNRYKTYRILNYGKKYTNYKTYNVKHHPDNTSNILAIYVDNQKCNNIPTNKSLLSCSNGSNGSNGSNVNNEKTALLQSKFLNKYFVEIHYTPEENKPKLEYIMTDTDINVLLSKYGYVMNMQ